MIFKPFQFILDTSQEYFNNNNVAILWWHNYNMCVKVHGCPMHGESTLHYLTNLSGSVLIKDCRSWLKEAGQVSGSLALKPGQEFMNHWNSLHRVAPYLFRVLKYCKILITQGVFKYKKPQGLRMRVFLNGTPFDIALWTCTILVNN